MAKIISIQRMGSRGVVQFVGPNGADALNFDAKLTDAEVRRLIEARKGGKNVRHKQG